LIETRVDSLCDPGPDCLFALLSFLVKSQFILDSKLFILQFLCDMVAGNRHRPIVLSEPCIDLGRCRYSWAFKVVSRFVRSIWVNVVPNLLDSRVVLEYSDPFDPVSLSIEFDGRRESCI